MLNHNITEDLGGGGVLEYMGTKVSGQEYFIPEETYYKVQQQNIFSYMGHNVENVAIGGGGGGGQV